jgi:hypothetical protein
LIVKQPDGHVALNDFRHGAAFSRPELPELFMCVMPFLNDKGAGKAGCRLAPAASCVKWKTHELVTTGETGLVRPSLRNGFTTYSALSSVTGLSCHRRPCDARATSLRCDAKHRHPRCADIIANLAPASGRQDHAASSSARFRSSASDQRMLRDLAATAARLHVRDDREAPLVHEAGCAADAADLGQRESRIFLARGLDEADQIDAACEIRFWARRNLPVIRAGAGVDTGGLARSQPSPPHPVAIL